MQQLPDSAFDFEEWALLARTDPDAFEARREAEIARLIDRAGLETQARLRGLQWQIDLQRSRAKSPLSACVQIFNQMWDSVYGDRGLLEALRGIDGEPLPDLIPGDVLEFQPRKADGQHDPISRPSTQS